MIPCCREMSLRLDRFENDMFFLHPWWTGDPRHSYSNTLTCQEFSDIVRHVGTEECPPQNEMFMILKAPGDLTIFEVGALYEEIKQPVTSHLQVELHLSEVDKLAASTIQLLIAVRRSERRVLTGMTDPMRARMAEFGA